MGLAETIFWLLVVHALCDFSLQTDVMAKGKSRHYRTEPPAGQASFPCWAFWLSAHALIWGGGMALVLGPALGAVAALAHWLTDFCKCEGWTTVPVDQAIHAATLAVLLAWR